LARPNRFAGVQGGQGDAKPGKAHHTVDHHVRRSRGGLERRRTHVEGCAGGKSAGQVGRPRLVGDHHHIGVNLGSLLGDEFNRTMRAQRRDPKPLRFGGDDLQRLGANRTGRAEYRHVDHGQPCCSTSP
jgi:hypothetical protein